MKQILPIKSETASIDWVWDLIVLVKCAVRKTKVWYRYCKFFLQLSNTKLWNYKWFKIIIKKTERLITRHVQLKGLSTLCQASKNDKGQRNKEMKKKNNQTMKTWTSKQITTAGTQKCPFCNLWILWVTKNIIIALKEQYVIVEDKP